ncbi:MAG: carboxymuconolactone decarboxylase family protein [Verrucomicrobia bacterium]|nr:carboxymuconolactone decarboxylase family protein [Verrucomicrobiota bacterium]
MKIRLTIKERTLTATLQDNKTARDFLSLLPLTLTLNDLFGREKFGHLPRAISEEAERAHTYQVGEMVYWSPGPDVAIFYRHDSQSIPDPGIIVIGKIDSEVDALNVDGPVTATIESAGQSANQTQAAEISSALPAAVPTLDDLRKVAPAFARYTEGPLLNGLWKRPDLSPRDRSITTVAALIARNQAIEMPYHFNLALDNRVKPNELSEIITHLAFYSGWANATLAVAVAKDVFAKRGIVSDQPPSGDLLPIDEAAEAQRAARVEQDAGSIAPGVVQYTSELLFHNLWLRPALTPRDRSLVTVSALIASGQTAQVTYHLNRAMDNGLTKAEASEMLTQLAFYAGWPNVFSAIPVVKGVFEKRPN